MSNLKINLIYYKNILDNVFYRFFEDYNDSFSRNDGKYIFSLNISRNCLKKKLTIYFIEELKKLITDYDILNPKFYFVIGSCLPCDNMLLNHIPSESKFPNKLRLFISQHPNIKYFLKEHDIKIDIEMFNCIFEEIFNKFFSNKKEILKSFGEKSTNLRFIKYQNLDCYSIYRIIKDIFGKINIVNLHKQNLDKMKFVIRSMNEIIGSYVLKKKEICRSSEFDMIKEEIKSYMINCMTGNI